MKKGKYQKAYESLLRLRPTPLQAARDLYYIHSQLELEAEIIGKNTYATRFIELFTIVGSIHFSIGDILTATSLVSDVLLLQLLQL